MTVRSAEGLAPQGIILSGASRPKAGLPSHLRLTALPSSTSPARVLADKPVVPPQGSARCPEADEQCLRDLMVRGEGQEPGTETGDEREQDEDCAPECQNGAARIPRPWRGRRNFWHSGSGSFHSVGSRGEYRADYFGGFRRGLAGPGFIVSEGRAKIGIQRKTLNAASYRTLDRAEKLSA